jgi:hypothetical protein
LKGWTSSSDPVELVDSAVSNSCHLGDSRHEILFESRVRQDGRAFHLKARKRDGLLSPGRTTTTSLWMAGGRFFSSLSLAGQPMNDRQFPSYPVRAVPNKRE